jgi:hypothetical protein
MVNFKSHPSLILIGCAPKNTSSPVPMRVPLDLFLRPVPGDDVFLGVQIGVDVQSRC